MTRDRGPGVVEPGPVAPGLVEPGPVERPFRAQARPEDPAVTQLFAAAARLPWETEPGS